MISNPAEFLEMVGMIAGVMEELHIGAVWFSFDEKGERKTQVFVNDNDTPDADHLRQVGAAFDASYELVRTKIFPEGEKLDVGTGQVSKG